MKITDHDHSAGEERAPVTLIEYGDYMNPDCKEAHEAVMLILDSFPGKVRFIYRHFVHDRVNREGFVASLAAEAAAAQDKFWEVHCELMQAAGSLASPDVVRVAEEVGLDMTRLLRDISHQTFSAKIRDDLEQGAVNGVVSTPTFFLNGQRLVGTFSAENLLRAIQACV